MRNSWKSKFLYIPFDCHGISVSTKLADSEYNFVLISVLYGAIVGENRVAATNCQLNTTPDCT